MIEIFCHFDSRKIEGVEMRWFGVYRSGVDKLIARGWVFAENEVARRAAAKVGNDLEGGGSDEAVRSGPWERDQGGKSAVPEPLRSQLGPFFHAE